MHQKVQKIVYLALNDVGFYVLIYQIFGGKRVVNFSGAYF